MLRILFVLAFLVPGLVMAVFSRYWALLLYFWNGFFRPQDFMWLPTQDLRLSLFIGLLLIVPAFLSFTFPNVTHPLSIGAIIFFLTGLVAQTNAIDQVIGWRWVDAHARLTIVCLLAITIIKTPRQWLGVLVVVVGTVGFWATKAGLVSLLGGGVQFMDGLDGTFQDNNGYALATVMVIPFMIALAQNTSLAFGGFVPQSMLRWVTLGLYVAVPLCIYTIISTFSRGGFIALVAAVLAYTAFHPRRIRLMFAYAALGSLVFVVPLPEGYEERIASIAELQEDTEAPNEDVTEGRLYFWGLAVRMTVEEPIGIGMRNFQAKFAAYDELGGAYGRRRDVHSSHFQVLVEQGFLGAAVWVFQFAYAFWVLFGVRRRAHTNGLAPEMKTFFETVPIALIVSICGFIVGGSGISLALNELTWLTFALCASLDRLSKQMCEELQREAAPPRAAPMYRAPTAALVNTRTQPRLGAAAFRSQWRSR